MVVSDSIFILDKPKLLEVSVTIENKGKYEGKETVQLYIRDRVASITRPVKEFRGFQQVLLRPGEKKIISFKLGKAELGFELKDLGWVVESGEFDIMVGGNSRDIISRSVELKHNSIN